MLKKSLALVLSLLMILSVVVALPASASESACEHTYGSTTGKCSKCGKYDWITCNVEGDVTRGASTTNNSTITTASPSYNANTGKLEAPTGGAVTLTPDLISGSDYSALYAPLTVSFDLTINDILLNDESKLAPFPLLHLIGNDGSGTTEELLALGALDDEDETVEVMFFEMNDRAATGTYGWDGCIEKSSIYTLKTGETYNFFLLIDPVSLRESVYINGEYAGSAVLNHIATSLTCEYRLRFGQGTIQGPYFFNYSLDNVDADIHTTIADAYAAIPTNQIFTLSYDHWQTGHNISGNRPVLFQGTHAFFGSGENMVPNAYTVAEDGSVYAAMSNSGAVRKLALSTTSGSTRFDLSDKKYEIRVNFALSDAETLPASGDLVRVYSATDPSVRWALVSYNADGTYAAHGGALRAKDGTKLTFVRSTVNGIPESTSDLRIIVDAKKGTYSIYVDGEVAYWNNAGKYLPFVDRPLSEAKTFTDDNDPAYDYLQLFAKNASITKGIPAILKEASITLIPDSDIEFIGSQARTSDNGAAAGTFDLRFAFGIDDLYVVDAGFRVTAYKNGAEVGAQTVPLTTVYKTLNAAGGNLYAYECTEGEYLAAFKIIGIEETTATDNYTFEITPYANGEDQDTYTVTYNGLGQIANPAPTPDEPSVDPDETAFVPTLRFIVTSDTHISTGTENSAATFKNAVTQIAAYVNDPNRNEGYGKLDAVAVAGDITGAGNGYHGGTEEEFIAAKNVFESVLPEGTELILALGNHDYGNGLLDGVRYTDVAIAEGHRASFESVFGVDAAQDIVIGGYHFITVDNLGKSPDNSRYGHDYSEESVAWVEETLAAANTDPGKPIFVFQHIGNHKTVIGTSADTYGSNSSVALTEVESKYPNLFVFSGHTHFQINDECSIYQGDYTAINTGALAGTAKSTNGGKDQTIATTSSPLPNAVYLVEADENGRVRVRMWSTDKNGFFGEEWIIDSYDKDEFTYTADRFDSNDLFFAENAKITQKTLTSTSITASFLPVPEESLTARAYEAIVTDGQGNAVVKKYISLPYYMDNFTTPATVTIDDLTPNTAYTLKVYAVNPLYNMDVTTAGTLRSEPLTLAFTTPEDPAAPSIIGFTIGESGISASNSLLTATGTPLVKYDETLGKNVLSFNENNSGNVIYFSYANKSDVVSALKEAFTLETYIRIDALPSSNAGDTLIGDLHNGTGFNLSIEKDGRVFVTFNTTDGNKVLLRTSACTVGTFNHITVTYDGTKVTLYVNGQAAESAAVSGLKLHEKSGFHKIFVGADINKDGVAEAHSNCTVAHLSMLCEALTAEAVAARAANFTTAK